MTNLYPKAGWKIVALSEILEAYMQPESEFGAPIIIESQIDCNLQEYER